MLFFWLDNGKKTVGSGYVKIAKRLSFLITSLLIFILVFGVFKVPVKAATAPHYKGFDIIWSPEIYYGSYSWMTGIWPFRTSHQENYYMNRSYYRCLTYYHDSWIQNQGQTLSITSSKTVSRSVQNVVSGEIGAEGTIKVIKAAGKVGYSHSTSTTTTYSTTLGLTYNLKEFPSGQYRIASMGYIDRFLTYYYKEGNFQESYNAYAYDHEYGQVITLVTR